MKHGDRVQETTTTAGTGNLSLAGATTGHLSFAAEIGDGEECTFLIEQGGSTAWELSRGTLTTGSPDTLTRTLIKSSTGSLLDLPPGTHTVSQVLTAALMDNPRPTLVSQPEHNIGNLGATPTVDPVNGNRQRAIINASATIALTAPAAAAAHLLLHLTVDATGGYSLTWPAGLQWVGGTAPDLDMTANAENVVTLIYANGGWIGDGGAL